MCSMEISMLAPMRLYTLSKGHFVLVFVVFFICFGLTVLIGISGPYVIDSFPTVLQLNNASKARMFNLSSQPLSTYNQQLWLTCVVQLDQPYDNKWKVNFNMSVTIRGVVENASVKYFNKESYNRTRTLSCAQQCAEIIVVHLGYLNYTRYEITVAFEKLSHDYHIKSFNFTWKTYNPTFSQVEIWFRFVFVVFTFIVTCLFAHSLRKFSMRDWGIEQKWMSILLPLLLLYNDPFFPLSFLINSWFPGMLDDLFQSLFLCALLLFWLCVYHGIRVQKSSSNNFLNSALLPSEGWFSTHLSRIRQELDSTSDSEASGEIPMSPSGPKLMDEFQLLGPDDVDKVLGRVRPTTCLLDPCPSLLINNAKHGIGTWILEVVNASLREGRVPAPLKEAVVQPVLKKASLDPEMAANYRPVANIPFLGKVLERVVAGQLQALLDETDYLDPFQSGFRPRYGTESALVTRYNDLCREKDRGSASLLVLLDLSAAFDTIDHGILLDRLAGLGVGGTALQWERSSGGEAVAVLNRCLAEVMGWMRANKLKLNPDKTEVLLVGGSGFGEGDLNLVLNGVALPLRDKVRSLGVLLDPELSLEAQVTSVVRSAFFQLWLIHQLHPYLGNDCLVTVTHALVTS
ncbi:hypothetical protein EYD10_00419 [Varanus komodoensis]|nr:hypothetical protein EYD10_00419 [Varanus komodoensis]